MAETMEPTFPRGVFVHGRWLQASTPEGLFRDDFMRCALCPIIRKNGHRFYGGKLPVLEISCSFWGALCLDTRHTARLFELYAVDVYAIGIYSIVNVKAADRCRTA